MRILIEFDSCWQTGFLGGDPNKAVTKKENDRPFVATSKTRGEKYQPITLDTVLGVLSRLIGDQRKLYQAKDSDFFYFGDIKKKISWIEGNEKESKINELMYLTNKSDDRCAQSAFLGVLDNSNPWFFSKNSCQLWSTLFLTKMQLIEFIISRKINKVVVGDCSPKTLISRINKIIDSKSEVGAAIKTREKITMDKQSIVDKKESLFTAHQEKVKTKPPKTLAQKSKENKQSKILICDLVEAKQDLDNFNNDINTQLFDSNLSVALEFLSNKFPDNKKLGEEYCKNGVVYVSSLYAAALYLQAEHLLANGESMDFLKNSKNEIQIQGFSKRGFNGVRDWLNAMTGKRKKSVGTPCIVQKHSGNLEIELVLDNENDRGIIDREISRAEEINQMIENAGVSSFYLGKKGLAYVSKIDTRPRRT